MTTLYRITLRLLPASLRDKHGPAMESMYASELASARTRGRVHALATGIAGIWDVLHRSAYELQRMGDSPMPDSHVQLPTTQQLLRRHAISFAVAFTALTAALLFVFAIRHPSLDSGAAASGIHTPPLLLALPFTAAMTIPMAVLLSVLYEFSRMGKNGTLTAARHVRDGVRRLVLPVLAAAIAMTAVAFVVTGEIVPRANERLASLMAGRTLPPGERSMTSSTLREAALTASNSSDPEVREMATSYEVELQKKRALPVACLILAMAGMALAFRIPRGGLALVVGGSLACFGAYYALLMMGEVLADQHTVSPFVGMWGANLMLLAVALLALKGRRTSSMAGARG